MYSTFLLRNQSPQKRNTLILITDQKQINFYDQITSFDVERLGYMYMYIIVMKYYISLDLSAFLLGEIDVNL